MSTPVDIKISLTKEGDGAAKAADDLSRLNDEAGKSTANTQAQAKATNELGEGFEKGAAAGRVLGEVARGNVFALGQLGAAIKAVATLLKANLLGAMVAIGALAFNLLAPLIKGFLDARKAAKDNEEAIKAAHAAAKDFRDESLAEITRELAAPGEAASETAGKIDAAVDAVLRLGEARMDTLKSELDAINRQVDETVAGLEAALKHAEALGNAKDQLALAQLETDPKLSEEQRIEGRAAIEERASARRAQSEIERASGVVGARTTARDQSQAQETEAARNLSAVDQFIKAFDESLAEANRQIARIVQQRNARFREIEKETLVEMDRQNLRAEASRKAQEEAAPFVARRDLLMGEEGLARRSSLAAERAAAAAQLDEANKAALEQAQKLAQAEAQKKAVERTQAEVLPVESEARKVRTDAAIQRAAEERQRREAAAQAQNAAELADADRGNLAARGGMAAGRLANQLEGSLARPEMNTPESADLRRQAEATIQASRRGEMEGLAANEGAEIVRLLAELIQLAEAQGGQIEGLKAAGREIRTLTEKVKSFETQIAGLRARANTK